MVSKNILRFLFLFSLLFTIGCAKRGNITGGDKDTIAPVLTASFPKNMTTNFSGKEIKLVFDEYVKLKNVNKQLIVSPPFKNQPEILPYTASKTITVKIKDTLLPNTTYSLNFGQSIEDNNEGNPYSQFKYVFSTGSYIDSLKLNVKVKDALEKKTDNFVSVMLYEINEKYTDSTIYKETPRYITNTLDSLKLVTIDNIKAGKYLLVALKDNGNNKYNPKSDKIGFQKQYITIPNDTIFEVEMFKEVLPFKALKPAQAAKSRMTMGYEGNPKGVKISIKNGETTIPTIITKLPEKDSVQIWYKPLKADSLLVSVEKENFKKEFWTKVKDQKKDSLKLTARYNGTIPLREQFSLSSSTPLVNFDKSKITIINKDSVAVDFSTQYDEFDQRMFLNFKLEPLEKYIIKAFPGAITDFYDNVNDTLSYKISTRNVTDYGNLRVTLKNVNRYPVILQLTDKDGKIKATAITENNPIVEFFALEPSKFTLRAIYDDNKNGVWDTGNFLEKRQSEEVIYLQDEFPINANWDWEQDFDLGIKN